ncbi:SgcJ/EcaC family oxidoreductase [Allonocardiopsis opalescens]|uniref:Uncharacterized protein (TIGR02246 family) n=1 Tax=Allonocardiopsis opalescens TaxID=1144618 RepID=A0A2T0Q9V8_9ACTN|nr:SgcJ/EcaC family oxidoreductase [Allonocardiopsis opalescens]PRY00679.1 uncharacterized protein (TIGR02246 family) [Allonocardiopsis opalescens]
MSHRSTTADPAAEQEIAALLDRMNAAWNAGDADAYGAVFTDDAAYVVFDGTLLHGRAAIADLHRMLFAGPLRGTRLTGGAGQPDGSGPLVRLLADGVAHIVTDGGMAMQPQAAPDPGHDSRVSLVAVREADGWRLAAFHNTRRRPAGAGRP